MTTLAQSERIAHPHAEEDVALPVLALPDLKYRAIFSRSCGEACSCRRSTYRRAVSGSTFHLLGDFASFDARTPPNSSGCAASAGPAPGGEHGGATARVATASGHQRAWGSSVVPSHASRSRPRCG